MTSGERTGAEGSGFAEAPHDACGVGFLAERNGQRSQRILPLALGALARMVHRGAVDADGRTGDGAGVMTEIPFRALRADLDACGFPSTPGEIAMGLLFLPPDHVTAMTARRLVEAVLKENGLPQFHWRRVPVDDDALGRTARRCRPRLMHLFVRRRPETGPDAFEAQLVAVRRIIATRALSSGVRDLYVASLSHRTLVYKALVRATDLALYFPDLRHPAYETSFAVFHQRFSTNTAPSWQMTQPFRLVAHNGEINTIDGNRRWMHGRAAALSRLGAMAYGELGTSTSSGFTSDSASLDEALASLAAAGRTLAHGMSLLMPPAWEKDERLSGEVRAFFDHQASAMEPWDGPALVVFGDGKVVGAALDRNGLRPARYLITTNGLVLVSSEVGVMDVDERQVVDRGRLGPGGLLLVDLEHGLLVKGDEARSALAAKHPHAEWLAARRIPLDAVAVETSGRPGVLTATDDDSTTDIRVLRAMGCTREELLLVLGPMSREGVEPLGSMGDDSPLAVLSPESRSLFSYFRQRFAQVTNPPIDSLREALVMSLDVRLGPFGDPLVDEPLKSEHVYLTDPILWPADIDALLAWKHIRWRAHRLGLLFHATEGASGFAGALEALSAAAERAARAGVSCLVLSDDGVDATHAALPTLLATAAVHQRLVRAGLRLRASIVVDAGDARDEHALAALLAFGADAVCPRLGYAAVDHAVHDAGEHDRAQARTRYRATLIKGLLKILAKMGVSTLRSYRGAGLFEAVGIADDVILRYFTGTPSAIGGIGIREIAEETLVRHRGAFVDESPALEDGGWHRYRKGNERHAYEPQVVKALHAAIRSNTRLDYQSYADLVHARPPLVLRDMMEVRLAPRPTRLDSVEPVEDILPRMMSAAMSLGSLSPEAQQTVAVAMNRIGARSNSGEGGESRELFWNAPAGAERNSARIKQVASGRFGVSAAYLMSADEIQIKMAQGSKPGEGGQLPGAKVTGLIARVRHADPGTPLISPPPHHDIYSIEDLAQLIYDLKSVNPRATVSVKLVSSTGIGTIAVGVAKAHADAIQISGHDGGTGASPRGSIKNVGTSWELGLSEAHQALVRGGLRGRVRLQVDGGLKTGRDVIMAALLGAEEFGFGTAALVAAGCVMARQCHLNTCPAGIATQREDLRKKFAGTPEDVIRFFVAVAEEVREILSLLGVSCVADIVGRTDLIAPRRPSFGKAATVRLDRMLLPISPDAVRRCTQPRNDPPRTGTRIDERVISELQFNDGEVEPLELLLPITNADRAVGARVAGELVLRTHAGYIAPRTVQLYFRGSAGQSFGAFCVDGMRLVVDGEANDYVGKGMSGGEIVLRQPSGSRERAGQVIAGNTILYGATGGFAFIAGRAGERFAVRNSGAVAVVEGTGDHAGEYMTAGGVVILGTTGRNLGAGMTGGALFAFDGDDQLDRRIHTDWVTITDKLTAAEEVWVRELVVRHIQSTGSRVAERLHVDWSAQRHRLRRITPLSAAVSSTVSSLPSLVRAEPCLERPDRPSRVSVAAAGRSAPAAPS